MLCVVCSQFKTFTTTTKERFCFLLVSQSEKSIPTLAQVTRLRNKQEIMISGTKRRLDDGCEASSCDAASISQRKIQRTVPELNNKIRQDISSDHVSPEDLVKTILASNHVYVDFQSYDAIEGFFEGFAQEEIDAYDHDILDAVRNTDLATLKRFQSEGRPMKCSNKFGESILHLACRRGLADVAKFLLLDAKVPVQLSDDWGRTPMHDSCWNFQPNFEIVDLLLDLCPDLLYIKDRRGFSPLSYTRKEHWGKWKRYFSQKTPEALTPRKLELF